MVLTAHFLQGPQKEQRFNREVFEGGKRRLAAYSDPRITGALNGK
jgi:hypothetical protein